MSVVSPQPSESSKDWRGIEIPLVGPGARTVFLLAVFVIASLLAFEAGKLGLADFWARSDDPQDWVRAAGLEPDNASHWFRLGRLRELDFEHPDLNQVIVYYQRATRLNPRAAGYWVALAQAYEMKGKTKVAQGAFERARAAFPVSAEAAWHYGNFLLRHGQLPEAFGQIRRAVEIDPNYADRAVALGWRVRDEGESLLRDVLPAGGAFYLTAFRYLLVQQETEAALLVWRRLATLGEPVELAPALALLDALIVEERIEEAKDVWQQVLQGTGNGGSLEGDSLVCNGGFEQELINGGFGWRQHPVAGAAFEFDTATYHAGRRSLRVDFDGRVNLDFGHLLQYIPVEPGGRYRLEVFFRTERISTDSGLRLALSDPRRLESLNILTPALLGTQPWSRQEVEFTTGPETRLLAVALRRLPSRKFDNKLRGTVWIDDVRLTPLPARNEP